MCSGESASAPPVPLHHAPVYNVFECLVVDHIRMSPCQETLTGQTVLYCLTLIDTASQWVVLVPIAVTTAKSSALAIQRHCIQIHVPGGCVYIPLVILNHDISVYSFSVSAPIVSVNVVGTFFPRLRFDDP